MTTTTDIGEEYLVDEQPDGDTIQVGLFNDDTDELSEDDDLNAITTEPDGNDYERQSFSVSTGVLSGTGGGDYGWESDAQVQIDVSDATTTVDSGFFIATFTSSRAGDSSDTEHLIGWFALETSYDLGAADTPDAFTFAAGDLEQAVSGTGSGS